MHILVGETALRALRASRYRGLAVALPETTPPQALAYLPSQTRDKEREADEEFEPGMETLETSGFRFERVEANAKVDLWRLGDVGTFGRDRPLELGVFESARARRRLKSRTRVLSRNLPEAALIEVSPHLYFEGPELILIHMASQTDAVRLAQIIMELCGTYSPCPAPDDNGWTRTLYDLPPVTTIERICAYARHVRQRGGKAVLQEALRLAAEGAASPAETILALVMSLPREMGGYGFPMPSLNAKLTVPDEERDMVGGEAYYLDAFWQDAYADLEYESTEFHLDPLVAASLVATRDNPKEGSPYATWRRERITKADADRRRMRDLQLLGLQVIPVTSFDLHSVRRLDQVAQALARRFEQAAGHDMDAWQADLEEKTWREARRKLLQALQPDETILDWA